MTKLLGNPRPRTRRRITRYLFLSSRWQGYLLYAGLSNPCSYRRSNSHQSLTNSSAKSIAFEIIVNFATAIKTDIAWGAPGTYSERRISINGREFLIIDVCEIVFNGRKHV